jgi:uncharacterized FlaG/YvyC family protein
MEIFDSTKSLLENVYYLSGILILITIIIGLIQLSIAKKTLQINSRRDAATLAAKQVEIYMTRVIPLQNKMFHFELKEKIERPKISIGEFTTEALINKIGKDEYLKIAKERIKLMSLYLPILNSMEAFSVYFMKEVADEEIAFSSVGRTFTKSVESLYFDVASCRGNESKSFQNLVELYGIWNNKLSKEKLENNQMDLAKQLDAIESVSIKPIGT